MELTERQKKFLIENQDRYTIRKFGKIFNMSGAKVLEIYSQMVDSGEFKKYYVNPLPYALGRKGKKNGLEDKGEIREQTEGIRTDIGG